jgi:predicted RNA methylase
MAVDMRKVVEYLRGFYDFTDRVLIAVGAGGGQFLDVYREAKRILAVDNDPEALRRLGEAVAARSLEGRVELVQADFYEVTSPAEVVLFEFSLHEMSDPAKALLHARSLAPEVVVFDHAPGSEWTHYTVEEEKVRRSTEAVERCGIKRRSTFRGEHRFEDHAELLARVASQGPTAVARIARFREQRRIVIPLVYGAALL